MSLSTYLFQRGKRGTWQLRVPIPRRLHAPGKPRERIKSLGTSDKALASRRALPILTAWQSEWSPRKQAAHMPLTMHPHSTMTEAELEQAAVIVGYDLELERYDRERGKLRGHGAWLLEHVAERDRQLLADRTAAVVVGDTHAVTQLANEIADALPGQITKGDGSYERLRELLLRTTLAAAKVNGRRLAGDIAADTDDPIVARVRQHAKERAAPGETLLELFERYAETRLAEGGKRDDTLAQDRKVIEQFSAFIGADRAIASITPADVREYRDTMRQLPPKWRDRADMRGLTMREAAAKARDAGMPRVTLTTINKHLSTVSPLFAWLIEERWDIANPCSGLFFKGVKGKNPRPPFGTERMNVILKSPLFVGFLADGKEHRAGNMRADDWRYWIPLLCLFTGMRVGEAAQLRTDDVSQHESGAWIIDLRHAPERGQTTKAGQSRAAVAHAKLIDLGFLAFVDRQRAAHGSDGRLFPSLAANDRDQIGAEPSAFWRDYLTRIGVKVGKDGVGAHSFRHELADRLRVEAGLVDDQIAVALGHDQKSTTGGYGAVRQGTVRFLAPVMAEVRFDGVSFGHLNRP